MTAREMWNFVHHFSLLVGDFVPKNDKVWHFFIQNLQVLQLILSPKNDESKLKEFKKSKRNEFKL